MSASDTAHPSVLFVSKPVATPFHDGSQVLVRNIANHLTGHHAIVMGTGDRTGFETTVEVDAAYRAGGGFAPALQQNLRSLVHVATRRNVQLWHFVFAPNLRSCRAIRALRRVRRVPTVQTVASPPRSFTRVDDLLFGDVVVAQSEWTAERIRRSARRSPWVEVVRPPLVPVVPPSVEQMAALQRRLGLDTEHEVVVYPGDLEFSQGAQRVAAMVSALLRQRPLARVVFACRRKTTHAVAVERELAALLNPEHVRFAGELPSLPALFAIAKAVVFPVEELFAKVDIPIALLEAISLGVPLVVPTRGPASELKGAVHVDADRPQAWVQAASDLLASETRCQAVRTDQSRHLANEFDAKVVAARYEELYHRLLRTV